MSRQTLTLIIILFLFTSLLVFLAINQSSDNSGPTSPKPASPAPEANLNDPDSSLLFGDLQNIASESATASPSALQVSQSSQSEAKKYSLPILIDTGVNKVSTVQLELAFDPGALTDVSINPAEFFENPVILINQIDEVNGRISYAIAASQSNATGTFDFPFDAALSVSPSASESGKKEISIKGMQGKGTLATLTFQINVRLETTTTISFLPKTYVLADGLEQSALNSTNSAELKFGN